MGQPAISLDAGASPGAAVSALTTLTPGEEKTLIELEGLAWIGVAMTDLVVLARIRNLSPGDLQWTDPVRRGDGVAPPGDGFEVSAHAPDIPGAVPMPALCLRLIAAQAVAITLTMAVVGAAPRHRVLAQALVSR
jgi:hypothetical protein